MTTELRQKDRLKRSLKMGVCQAVQERLWPIDTSYDQGSWTSEITNEEWAGEEVFLACGLIMAEFMEWYNVWVEKA